MMETRVRQLNTGLADAGRFQNIKSLPTPYALVGSEGRTIGANEAVELCVKAYCGIPVVRNAIEVAVEFSSQPLYVKSKYESERVFFEQWLLATGMASTAEQFFRSWYREGAAYLYTLYGQFSVEHYALMQRAFRARQNKVPIRYELINPFTVSALNGLTSPYTYVRALSQWEVDRLRHPLTELDRQVYRDLPAEVREQIRSGAGDTMGLNIPLDPKRLKFAHYKRQGWEPFGIPFIWPVLPSIEWKLTLTKMDMALARTVEQAILLITTGEEGNEWNKGNGINPRNIARLQALFKNHTIGRVLVADYTTKGQWLIPDIQEILGPEKYQIVNEDIKEGLQSILTGSDKFANAQIKAKIFIQRLREGQNKFLNDFLMPEVRAISETMGFREVPTVNFAPIDLQDAALLSRVYTQLAQIGAITPEQAVEAIQTQVLPDSDELVAGHEKFKKLRDKGLFQPLIGGKSESEGGSGGGMNGRPGGITGVKLSGTRNSAPIGQSRASIETDSDRGDAFSIAAYAARLKDSQKLDEALATALRAKYGVKGGFTPKQTAVKDVLMRTIIASHEPAQWVEAVAATLEKPAALAPEVVAEIDEIAQEYRTDRLDAAILRHCRTEAPAI